MAVIGIIGGVACGKSFVAEQFRSLGAEVINADRIGHEVLRESDVRAALVQRWGDKVLDADGQVSRSAIGQRVFSGKSDERGNLEFLESLVHPKIGQRIGARIEALSRDDPGKSVVVDAALLMEADAVRRFRLAQPFGQRPSIFVEIYPADLAAEHERGQNDDPH
ncbi:MAG: dephospho-CoA kinase [Pirellulaceae bacterium]|nr:dephospho-CoA kinase [Pirellulaceae bacterium]